MTFYTSYMGEMNWERFFSKNSGASLTFIHEHIQPSSPYKLLGITSTYFMSPPLRVKVYSFVKKPNN